MVVKNSPLVFQHTAARRRLDVVLVKQNLAAIVSTHSRPKAAGIKIEFGHMGFLVSTHSRPKAAGPIKPDTTTPAASFNTQPPEGGWELKNTEFTHATVVSTHSRPKAAGRTVQFFPYRAWVSTHSRPKAAGMCR